MIAKQKIRREKNGIVLKKNAIFLGITKRAAVEILHWKFSGCERECMGECCQSHFDMRHSLNHLNDLNISAE